MKVIRGLQHVKLKVPDKVGYVKGKSKAIAVQAWVGPEGLRSVRLPDFKTIGILMR